MGFKPAISRAFAAAALLTNAAGGIAAPREPLTITQLKDSGAMLQPSSVSLDGGASAADDGMESFSRAVNEALRLERQAREATCRSQQRGTGTITVRSAWEAHCRYFRY
jgi:hypothetical protein